ADDVFARATLSVVAGGPGFLVARLGREGRCDPTEHGPLRNDRLAPLGVLGGALPAIAPNGCSPTSSASAPPARSTDAGPGTDRSGPGPAPARHPHGRADGRSCANPPPGAHDATRRSGPRPPVASDADTTPAAPTHPPTPPDPRWRTSST